MWKIFAALMLIGVVAGRVNRPYDIERLREAVERECKMYGGEEHVEDVMAGTTTYVDCVYDSTSQEALARLGNANDANFNSEIISFIKTTCKRETKIHKCFNNFLDAYSPCADPKEREHFDITRRSFKELTSLFCIDDSKRFSEFIDDGGILCLLEDQLISVANCILKLKTLENYATVTTAEACTKLEEVTSCILGVSQNCPKPTTKNFIQEIFRIMYNGSLCRIQAEEENEIAVNAV